MKEQLKSRVFFFNISNLQISISAHDREIVLESEKFKGKESDRQISENCANAVKSSHSSTAEREQGQGLKFD